MPPKKKNAAVKTATVKDCTEAQNFLEQLEDEADQRKAVMRKEYKKLTKRMFEQMCEAIDAKLDPIILNMKLGDFLAQPEMVVPKREVQSPTGAGDGADDEETAAALAAMAAAPQPQLHTAQRPTVRGGRVNELRTPAGKPFTAPAYITPKVNDLKSTTFRTIRRDEVCYSAHGSPVVPENGVEAEINIMHNLLTQDEATMSPDTKELAITIRNIVQKKLGK